MILKSQTPVYGENYKLGYSGFTFTSNSLISQGVAWFERWDRLSDFRVSHCFVVTGADQCCEALAGKDCVCASHLQARFDDPHCLVFFRKPRDWDLAVGADIATTALSCVGQKYDHSLAAGHIVPNSWLLRRLLSKPNHRHFEEWFLEKCNSADEWTCSELNAYAMDEQPRYHDKGILSRPNFVIKPQQLFEDEVLFEDWKGKEGVSP